LINSKLRIILAGIVSVLIVGGCQFYAPCDVPKTLDVQDVYGEWVVTYRDHYVSDPLKGSIVISDTIPYLVAPEATPMALDACPFHEPWAFWERCYLLFGESHPMEGVEVLLINSDGTYRQFYMSSDYFYASPVNRWEFIPATPDGPKLRMEGMKYFAEGIARANGASQMRLSPQTVDLLRIQDHKKSTDSRDEAFTTGVIYPDYGYVFLYPRLCKGELSLVPMGWRVSDPDGLAIDSPVFQKEK